MSELEIIAKSVDEARCPEDVFGHLPKDDAKAALGAIYRRLVVVAHPDHYQASPGLRKIADVAFRKLTELRVEAERKIDLKTYGDRVSTPSVAKVVMDPIVVEVKKRRYTVTEKLWQGDICDLYKCSYQEDKKDHPAVFKVAQHASDNDLVQNEWDVLSKLYPKDQVDEKYFRYLVKPIDSFTMRSKSSNRRVVILPRADGFVPLTRIMEAFPDGLDFRDMVWMFKRALTALGFIHRNDVIHGAILPSHILVHPIDHGAKIIDWCYAVPKEKKIPIKAISAPWKHFYPAEVLAKKNPTSQTDIYMLVKCMMTLVQGTKVPDPLMAFLKGCSIEAMLARPDDAWALYDELTELLKKLVGKPKYRKLELPGYESN